MESENKTRVSLAELLEIFLRRVSLDEIRVSMPATVVKYIPATTGDFGPLPAMVEVELDHKYARRGFEGDAAEDETFNERSGGLTGEGELVGDYPTFTCAVHFPGPSSMWSRGVIEVGEQGNVLFTDRDLGRWLVAGRDGGATVDAGYSWSHGQNMCSSYFMPGLASGPQWPADVPADGGKIGPRDGSAGMLIDSAGVTIDTNAGDVTLDGALVKLGSAAAQVLALLPELKTPVATLAAVYAGLPGAVYAVDAPAIKAGWAAFAASWAALVGSAKGRG